MISQQLASLEGIELGDRLPLSLYPDSDAERLGSRFIRRTQEINAACRIYRVKS